jgi:hypothetical protein
MPPAPFLSGYIYLYPTRDDPNCTSCLRDCGADPVALNRSAKLNRGIGSVRVGTT